MDTAANGCPWVANLASEAPSAPVIPARHNDGPDPREVRDFFEQYQAYTDMDEAAYTARIAAVMAEIQATDTYTLRTTATDRLGNVSGDERAIEIAHGIPRITR